jgi:hypothetical protein
MICIITQTADTKERRKGLETWAYYDYTGFFVRLALLSTS